MNLPKVFIKLIGIALLVTTLGCSSPTPVEVAPTPNIDATVEARAKELVAAQATEIATPIPTQQPTITPTPIPTQQPTITPTPLPTQQPTITPPLYPLSSQL